MSEQAVQSKKLTLGALLFTFSLIAAISVYTLQMQEPEPQQPVLASQDEVAEPEPEPVTVQSLESRFMVFGDVMWGRRNQTLAEANGGPRYLFEELATLNRQDYDAWMINLECPVTTTEVPQSEQERLLRFNCLPSYLEEAAKWFDIASLANNHTDNVNGESGLNETRWQLEGAGIQHFGHYENAALDELCDVIALPARTLDSAGEEQSVQLPVALCGYHGVFKLITDEELAVISRYSDIMPVIVMPHMGAEYEPTSDSIRQGQYRAMIDNGADLVVGGHPHWVQNTEVYKDKLIVYSLGNFLFDQAWSEEVQRGMGLDVTMKIPYDDSLAKWLELGPDCEAFADTCLQTARDANLTELDVDFTYDVVATQYNQGQTSRASDNAQELVRSRANWVQTLNQLGQ